MSENMKSSSTGNCASEKERILNLVGETLSDEMGFTYYSINSINTGDESNQSICNLRAVGIAIPQHEQTWLTSDISGTIRMNYLLGKSISVVEGVIPEIERQWYTVAESSEVVRVFIPLLDGSLRYGGFETGFFNGERAVPDDSELNLLRAFSLQAVIALYHLDSAGRFAQEHRLLNTLLDTIPDAIYFKDRKSRFIKSSRALAEKIGLDDPDALIGKTDFDLFTDEHAEQAFTDEQHIVNTGEPEIDIVEKETWADSRITWVSTTKMPLYDDEGTITGTFGISRDITQRKEMEEALKRSEEKLQHANSVLEQRVAERTEDLRNANELLRTHIGQLSYLNNSVYKLSQVTTVDALPPVILDVFMDRFPKAEGAICLLSDEKYKCVSATAALQREDNYSQLEEVAAGLAGSEIHQPVLINSRAADERIHHINLHGIIHLRTLVVIPLMIDAVCRAQLQIYSTDYEAAIFYLEQSLLTTLAAHAAICLSNAINYQERAEKARLDGELDAARSIQRRFTPQTRPDIPGIDLRGVYFPAHKVGGDYLDYFQTERGDWVVVIADVCGKGIPAALLMTTMRSAIRIFAEKEITARALLCAVNRFMTQNIDERSFVTALCLVITADGRSMSYARAGHPMLVKLDRDGGMPHNVTCGGIALGLMNETEAFADIMEEKTIPLESGDRFLVYTDGLVEATDSEKNTYGFPRLSALLSGDTGSDPEGLIGKIIDDIKEFVGGAPDYDDLTLLVFKVS